MTEIISVVNAFGFCAFLFGYLGFMKPAGAINT